MKAVNLHKFYFDYITKIAESFECKSGLNLDLEFSFFLQPFFHMRSNVSRGVYEVP
jgi:hypothetical protein